MIGSVGLTTTHAIAKRTLDVAVSALALVVLSPLMVLIALSVRADSGGPALFLQARTGLRGRQFRIIKFRTMTDIAAEVNLHEETTSDDPRITRVGRVLRAAGLDELPQLFNVLVGQMSLVGPRPLLAWEIQQCSPRQAQRLLVKPGLTGLAQVMGRNAIPWNDRIEWDLAYIDRASIGLDLWILFWTVPVVLLGKNAYLKPRPPCAMHGSRPSD
ncbi:MAG TPA: sugar transferase [Tepidisphaeraceae bacterium]|jgi:lipopolysaccharide/colanic/teichoic acid biosynthesis glycosyltransferase|nr:sugar transferase [Tepidisphaeraceae bacterium]